MSIKRKPTTEEVPSGLIGLFGHAYISDPDHPSEQMIQYQFRVIRKMEGDRYVVQYFSFQDGSPTCVGVYHETELLGPTVKLYANRELWLDAYETESPRAWRRRES